LAAVLTVGANLLMRLGVDRAGGFPSMFSEIPYAIIRLAIQPAFDLGVLLYVTSALVWFRVIATEHLSTAYPLLVSLTFIFVTLGAVILFHESLNLIKIIGLGIIILGIIIVSRS
jgi:multidrug transporter EmrE-like cation transporter